MNKQFEKIGLKIEKHRVLTFSGLNCPIGCKYCFVENMNPRNRREVFYLSNQQFELLRQLPDEVNLIMLRCDTEFFQSRDESLRILAKLPELKKDISVVTKMFLPRTFVGKLKSVGDTLKRNGNFLTLSLSIPCFDSATIWEPKAPSPEKRIETLQMAHEEGLSTLVAIRPLLPTATNKELDKIVDYTKIFCFGYYSGPLYLKDPNHELLMGVKDLHIEKIQPHWMPEGSIFYKIEKPDQMSQLEGIVKKHEKPIFEGAAEAIDHIRKSIK
ncbi:MAG: radical SAM domain-containing protein [Parcubacteria group bacterium Licking1014_17]|nr:MAG: radical SAM domain-containing protein [Parcubacteria group bacterium Licking1014_17]